MFKYFDNRMITNIDIHLYDMHTHVKHLDANMCIGLEA